MNYKDCLFDADSYWAFDELISLNLIHFSKKLNDMKLGTI